MGSGRISPKTLAAITAAVQAYLDEEAASLKGVLSPRLNPWRAVARGGQRLWSGRS
ncbi:MAG: hypothetical protein IIC23_02265 [Chloroflexi bacterium]|nr:hypothetical protein [Chloroflexota bacterium]